MTHPSRRVLLTVLCAAPGAAFADPLAKRFGGPFTLTAHTGARMSDKDFRGRFMLTYFGFTNCADTCPGDLLTIGHALDALGPAQTRIQPLFITVDPEFDTPSVMAGYLANFHPRIIGLTGDAQEIASVAKAYRVHRMLLDIRPRSHIETLIHLAHGSDGHGYRGGAQTIDHGSLAYLMGPDGGFLTLFPTATDAKRMNATLAIYLARHPT